MATKKKKGTAPTSAWRQTALPGAGQRSFAAAARGDEDLVAHIEEDGLYVRSLKTGADEKIEDGDVLCVRMVAGPDGRLHVLHDRGGVRTNVTDFYNDYATAKSGISIQLRTWNGKRWTDVLVTPDIGEWIQSGDESYFALAVDGAGIPHVAYFRMDSIWYGELEGDEVPLEKVTAKAEQMSGTTLAVDAAGNAAIVYGKDFELYVARWVKGKFVHEKLGGEGGNTKYMNEAVAAAFDPSGALWVAAQSSAMSTKDRLVVWRRDPGNGGKWGEPAMPDRQGNNGFDNALAIDARGVVRVAHRRQHSRRDGDQILENAVHCHAVLENGEWRTEEVAEGGWRHALALAADGTPRHVFRATLGGGLSIAQP
jgi:hypothetical protein